MGLTVAVADYDPGAVGIPYADCYYNVSTVDEAGICAAAEDFQSDGIITLATDMPMRSVGYTCQKLGLCGIDYETALRATDKGEMIKAFCRAGLACPKYYLPEVGENAAELRGKLDYPLVCKPTDNSGSRGVVLVQSEDELDAAMRHSTENSRSHRVILEEYLVGSEISVEIAVWDGEASVLAVTDKQTTGAPQFVEIGHSQPSRHPSETVEKIKKLAIDAVKAVGIDMGTAHVEIMVTEHGPVLIELGARMGGDCITTHLVPYSCGIDMIKANIDIALGNRPNVSATHSRGAAIRFVMPPNGIISEISGVHEAECVSGVRAVEIMKQVGDIAHGVENSSDRLGFVIAQADTADEALSICQKAAALITATVRTEGEALRAESFPIDIQQNKQEIYKNAKERS
ncbi:MAG: ATP-grasp domain-containing protein [Clostridia bacterium]|nr:ATP-grasp domain-containing protein [Clostridia bacterium]